MRTLERRRASELVARGAKSRYIGPSSFPRRYPAWNRLLGRSLVREGARMRAESMGGVTTVALQEH